MDRYLRKMFAGLIDAALVIFIYSIVRIFFPHTFRVKLEGEVWVVLLVLLLYAFYRLVMLFIIKGTIGMHMFGIELLNADKKYLSVKEILFASFFILIDGVNYYEKKRSR